MSEPAIKIEAAHVTLPAVGLRKGGFSGPRGIARTTHEKRDAERAAKRATRAKSIKNFFRGLFH